ncbi:hypothetical protein LC048_09505 [Mesobacillus subterraneus]|uniref:hypothetical protein n=1 Tax=Mesobacillus subterraneus TaxID=285983 RepID=UPI001CFD52C9|nr:hypothetical protein [Mesobacillus subterraneus]WLR57073.1 hypothetical protein LC048_09505 [Mesobacillus subterraneus]
MGLVSIVAREDFISLVTDLGIHQMIENIRFKEIIPDTAFIAISGDDEYAMMTASAAETLIKQGFSLKEMAESIQSSINNPILMLNERPFEAVVAGYSQNGEAQYHVISNTKPLESYYPRPGESLYYVNGHESMLVLEKSLKMHGMGTVDQARAAQIHLFREAAKTIPNVNTHAESYILKKVN